MDVSKIQSPGAIAQLPGVNRLEFDNRRAWLKARQHSIGSSDVSGIMGLSRFSSPWSVWKSKVRPLEEGAERESEIAEWGRRHEPAITLWFRDQSTAIVEDLEEVLGREVKGFILHDPGDFSVMGSPERPNHTTTLDRLLCLMESLDGPREPVAVVELKCAYYDAATEWEERVPLPYQMQIQHQMYVTGLSLGYFVVLRDGYRPAWYRCERDEEFIGEMLYRCGEFWKLVEANEPPPADFSDATKQAIGEFHPKDNGEVVQLGTEFADMHDERKRLKAEIKNLGQQDQELANQFRAAIGDNSAGSFPGATHGYRWKLTAKGNRSLTYGRV